MVSDYILLRGVLVMGTIWALIWVAEILWRWHKDRKTAQQIIDGVVPQDYSEISRVAQEMNARDDVTQDGMAFRHNANQLLRIRNTVALIRVDGYDRAMHDRETRIAFQIGVKNNPHPRHSGEAKQWVRGYCQGCNVANPKPYMDKA